MPIQLHKYNKYIFIFSLNTYEQGPLIWVSSKTLVCVWAVHVLRPASAVRILLKHKQKYIDNGVDSKNNELLRHVTQLGLLRGVQIRVTALCSRVLGSIPDGRSSGFQDHLNTKFEENRSNTVTLRSQIYTVYL